MRRSFAGRTHLGHARIEWMVLIVLFALAGAAFVEASRSMRSLYGGLAIGLLTIPYGILGIVLAVLVCAGIPEWLEAKTGIAFGKLSNVLWPLGIVIMVLPGGLFVDKMLHDAGSSAARMMLGGSAALWVAGFVAAVYFWIRRARARTQTSKS